MPVILTCGLPRLPWASSLPNLLYATDTRDSDLDPIAVLSAQAATALGDGDTVIALVPEWTDEPTQRHLQTVRSALDTTRLLIHPTHLPPLSAASFATLLAECAAHPAVTAADLLPHLPVLERCVVGAAWLGSVARLRWPAPTLGQHARSWLPGSAFAAVIDDEPRLVRLRKDDTIPLPEADSAGWRVEMAVGEGNAACVERSLARHTPRAEVSRSALGPVSTRWWGTDEVVELALRPHDARAVAGHLLRSRPVQTCTWCGQRVGDPVCPFCHMHQAGSAPPTPTATAPA